MRGGHSVHSGHRERMKQRFRETGFNGFNDVNVLELLLFYAIPRQDTNPIAHALLNRFGGLNEVIDAPYEDLLKVPGVGENVATFLKLIPAVCKRYTIGRRKPKTVYTTIEEMANFVVPLFSFDMEETLYMICLDSGNRIIFCEPISVGGMESVRVEPRKIVEIALARRASRVVLAHNHPSGIAAPSESDISLTYTIRDSLRLLDIELMDHFIVAEEMCVSLRKHGCLS